MQKDEAFNYPNPVFKGAGVAIPVSGIKVFTSLSPLPFSLRSPLNLCLYSLSHTRPFSLLHFLFPILFLFRPYAHLNLLTHAHCKYKHSISASSVSNMYECDIEFIRQPTHCLWEERGWGFALGRGRLFTLVRGISRICSTVVRAS